MPHSVGVAALAAHQFQKKKLSIYMIFTQAPQQHTYKSKSTTYLGTHTSQL